MPTPVRSEIDLLIDEFEHKLEIKDKPAEWRQAFGVGFRWVYIHAFYAGWRACESGKDPADDSESAA